MNRQEYNAAMENLSQEYKTFGAKIKTDPRLVELKKQLEMAENSYNQMFSLLAKEYGWDDCIARHYALLDQLSLLSD